MLDFTRKLTIPSAIKYLFAKVLKSSSVIVRMRSGPRFEVRRQDVCANNDYGVAYEVFVHDDYEDYSGLPPDQVRFIVDLGANVGLSSLKFLLKYPNAKILAFEPHPEHARQARRNFRLSGVLDRVTLVEAGAGAKDRFASFHSNMTSSCVVPEETAGAITVKLVDILATLQGKRIDLLKMDIEGGEYEVMSDQRFPTLDIGQIVMEWHGRGDSAADKQWCQDRLATLGFQTEDIFSLEWGGMMWATRGPNIIPTPSKRR